MFRLAVLCVCACASGLAASSLPDDDLDRALRAVDPWDMLKEGVDYHITDVGLTMPGLTCYIASSLRCMDQNMHCRYVNAGTICTYCDGTGGMWFATSGLCVQDPASLGCVVNPAGNTKKCGKQRRSTCVGAFPNHACPSTATSSNRDCYIKECT